MCGEVPTWDSVGLCVRLLVRGPPLAGCSAPFSKRRAQGFSLSGFLLFCWWPSVSLIPTGVFRVSSPTLSTHLSMPLRGPGQHPGSESLLYGSLPEHWRPLCDLGFSCSLRSWRSPPLLCPTLGDGAQRQDLAPGRDLSTSRPVHPALQTFDLVPHVRVLVHTGGPNRHGGQGHSSCQLDQRPLLELVSPQP